jgi:uncharacterized membrane protein YjjP (DUF1212 family)
MCCGILFASILLGIFVTIFIKDNWSIILLFLIASLLGLGMNEFLNPIYWHHRMSLVVFLTFLVTGKVEEYWY